MPADATAFGRRDAGVLCDVIARSPTAAGFDGGGLRGPCGVDARGPPEITAHGDGGLYVDFTGDAGEDKVRAACPDAVHRRLVEVKDAYDPANMFRLNQNIRPSAGLTATGR
ncbi:BBE domain-containing protein [Streptomyces sp. PD-S100-1]|uniref:BBE domain-containing protein n=1 Tax=Streptomyces sp. PD-S100-1 TaxID=3394351 RepID=UPI0039BC3D02